MITIYVENTILDTLKSFRLGIIQAVAKCKHSSPELHGLIQITVCRLMNQYTLENIKKIGTIAAAREAYRKMGNDPNRYRPAADSLIRHIVKGMGLNSVNDIVDVLNIVSVSSGFSISGFDVEKVAGKVCLGIGQSGEPYRGIGREEVNINKLPVLRDQLGAFGSPTSDSEQTMITLESENIIFVFYDLGNDTDLEPAIKYCHDLILKYCSAKEFHSEVRLFEKNA